MCGGKFVGVVYGEGVGEYRFVMRGGVWVWEGVKMHY